MILPDHTYLEKSKFQKAILEYRAHNIEEIDYLARIRFDKRDSVYLGCFNTALEAANVRDRYIIDNNLWTIEYNNNSGSNLLLNRYLFPEDFRQCTTF